MEKKHIIIIGVLVIIIAILAVAILSMNNVITFQETGTVKINSEDNSMSGKLKIIEFKNIKKNSNGTYNVTQFYNRYGVPTGTTNDILIKDGKAEYTLHNDTEFFIIEHYITDIKPNYGYGNNGSAPLVTVDYSLGGKSVLSSSDTAYADQCDVTFGGRLYALDGSTIPESSFNIDIPELKAYLDRYTK